MKKAEEPRISTWPGDGGNDDPPDVCFMYVAVNGNTMPAIRAAKEIVYDLGLQRQVQELVRAAYHRGRLDGEAVGKQKVADLFKWAKT